MTSTRSLLAASALALATPAHSGTHQPTMAIPAKPITQPHASPMTDGTKSGTEKTGWRVLPDIPPVPFNKALWDGVPCYGNSDDGKPVRCAELEH